MGAIDYYSSHTGRFGTKRRRFGRYGDDFGQILGQTGGKESIAPSTMTCLTLLFHSVGLIANLFKLYKKFLRFKMHKSVGG